MRVLRVVLVLLIALLAWLQYRLWFGHGGAGEVQQLSAQVDKQKRGTSKAKTCKQCAYVAMEGKMNDQQDANNASDHF